MASPLPRLLFFAHDVERSGAPRVTTTLARAFADDRFPVSVCFPATGGCEADARALGLETHVVVAPVVSLATTRGISGKLSVLRARFGALRATRQLLRDVRPDVVWIGSSVGLVPLVAAALHGLPRVVHVHETLSPTTGSRLRAMIVRHLARAVVFVGEKSKAAFEPRPPAQRWTMLPNFLPDRPRGGPSREDMRAALEIPQNATVVLAVGFLRPHKGFDVLVEALARIPDSDTLVLIAGGEAESDLPFAEALHRLIDEKNLGGRVRLLGHRDDIADLMKAADLFVHPSRNDTLPLVVAEAMQAGLPVVATRVGSIEDMVVDGETGVLVQSDDAAALASAMESLLADNLERRAMGERGRERAESLWSQARIMRDARELVLTLARGG